MSRSKFFFFYTSILLVGSVRYLYAGQGGGGGDEAYLPVLYSTLLQGHEVCSFACMCIWILSVGGKERKKKKNAIVLLLGLLHVHCQVRILRQLFGGHVVPGGHSRTEC